MRILVAALVILSALASGGFAAASCAPPASVADNAGRADAVVHGRITGFEGLVPPGASGRVAIVEVLRVLKGSVPARITVALGPAVAGGGVVATSVDYRAEAGTDHTLYLRKGTRMYETNECVGDHPGAPTSEEERVIGPGGPPQGSAPRAAAGPELDPAAAIGIGLAIASAALAALYVMRTRRRVVPR